MLEITELWSQAVRTAYDYAESHGLVPTSVRFFGEAWGLPISTEWVFKDTLTKTQFAGPVGKALLHALPFLTFRRLELLDGDKVLFTLTPGEDIGKARGNASPVSPNGDRDI